MPANAPARRRRRDRDPAATADEADDIMRIRASLALRGLGTALLVALAGCQSAILDPRGPVGRAEKIILIDSLAIMLAIIVPTMVATLVFAWWFRASNRKAT